MAGMRSFYEVAECLELEAVFRRAFSDGDLDFTVRRKMGEAVIDVLGIGVDFRGDGFGGFYGCGEVAADFVEGFQEGAGGLFSRFHTGLVIGVDVHE